MKVRLDGWYKRLKQILYLRTKIIEHPVLAKHLGNLEHRFQGAFSFLKNTSVSVHHKKIILDQLPWYLLIGSPKAGKTTLLANSGIKFILSKHKREEIYHITTSENCDWWVTQDAVIVDVPGRYILKKQKISTLPNRLWQHFLRLMQKQKSLRVNGLIVAISLPELIDQSRCEKLIWILKTRLEEVSSEIENYKPAIYFVITKCDLLPGFTDFFSDYGSDELTQAWGVNFAKENAEKTLVEIFNDRFNVLIKRLNKQLIHRLHQERNPYTKLYIKDFPLHLERLKEKEKL